MKIFRFDFQGSMEIAAHCGEDAFYAFKDACAEAGVVIDSYDQVSTPDLGIV